MQTCPVRCNLFGSRLSKDGLSPTGAKLEAIRDAPQPDDAKLLKSFVGLVMYYSKFLPCHSTVLAPLNELTRKGVRWRRTKVEQDVFQKAKDILINSETVVHYDDSLPLCLSCAASQYGAGAVLTHKIDGIFRPIAFASVTLKQAQQIYSQLDKEAFSVIFGLKRFHQFLAG